MSLADNLPDRFGVWREVLSQGRGGLHEGFPVTPVADPVHKGMHRLTRRIVGGNAMRCKRPPCRLGGAFAQPVGEYAGIPATLGTVLLDDGDDCRGRFEAGSQSPRAIRWEKPMPLA
jgi:hypothetical protein